MPPEKQETVSCAMYARPVTSVASPPTQPIRPRIRTARGTLIATFSAVAGAALAVLAAVVIAVRTSADGKTDILIGQYTSTRIAVSALLVAGIAGVVALALTRWHGRRLLLLIPALLVALGAAFLALLVLWLQSSNTLTPLLSLDPPMSLGVERAS